MARKAADVLAAGAVVWRERRQSREVLVIHRPRYNDWSLPKGKVDRRESLPATAVREVEEETGYRVRLGRPLPAVRYRLPDGRRKQVSYWAATVLSRTGPGPQDRREVDETRWVSLSDARKMLTRREDRDLIAALNTMDANGELETAAVIVQRHAAALSRAKWGRAERTRPLNSKGKKQAKALPPLIGAFAPDRVVTSPWKRCLATVEPFAKRQGMEVITKDDLTEAGHEAHPARTRAVIARVMDEAAPAVICTHRPVLPSVMKVVRGASSDRVASMLPREDPYLAAGEAMVLHVTAGGIAVAMERHLPDIG